MDDPTAPFEGARVRRVDLPAADLLTVTLGGGGWKETLVFALAPPVRGVGLVAERPKGRPASGFVRKLRKELEGAAIGALEHVGPDRWHLHARRGSAPRTLVAEATGPHGNALLLDGDAIIRAALHPGALRERGTRPGARYVPPADAGEAPHELADCAADSLDVLREQGTHLLAARSEDALARRARILRRALRSARKRVERKIAAIDGDAERAADVPELRRTASLILAHLHQARSGDREVEVTDWEHDPPIARRIPLDGRRSPKEHADRLFHQARRLERGAEIAARRRTEAVGERNALDALETRLETEVLDAGKLHAIATEAQALGVRGAREALASSSARAPSSRSEARHPYRRFAGAGDRAILVGRGARDNDTLTLQHARPHDLWLHARDHRGAHVVVPLGRNEDCPPQLLADAATLATHFSDARGEERAEIQYTPRRFVRKTRGAPPGAVRIERERVLSLRVEPERLRRLLATEL